MVNISLKKVESVESYINLKLEGQTLDTSLLHISFENNTKFSNTQAVYTLKTEYTYKKEIVLLLQSIEMTFIGDFSQYSDDKDSEELREVILQIQSIGIGTMRGIIVAKTQGTFLQKYPLPLIGTSFLQQNIEKAIEEKGNSK